MCNALAQDAQNMLEEMKNDSLLLDFENARQKTFFKTDTFQSCLGTGTPFRRKADKDVLFYQCSAFRN